MAEVRSSKLETGLSSSGDPERGDTTFSTPRVVKHFHAFEEVCGLDDETVGRFKDRFQFPERVRVRRPTNEDRACHFFPGEVRFYEVAFTCGLRLPVHPFIMELLGFFGIAPGQLMPNSWRIVINYMEIWLASSFRYWKFRFVFVFGDDFETPASEAWGDVPRLLRRWGTPHLGASILSIVCWFLFLS